MENEFCPCCGRHCPLDNPNCDRGREYAKTGVIPSRNDGEDRENRHRRHCEGGHGHHGRHGRADGGHNHD